MENKTVKMGNSELVLSYDEKTGLITVVSGRLGGVECHVAGDVGFVAGNVCYVGGDVGSVGGEVSNVHGDVGFVAGNVSHLVGEASNK